MNLLVPHQQSPLSTESATAPDQCCLWPPHWWSLGLSFILSRKSYIPVKQPLSWGHGQACKARGPSGLESNVQRLMGKRLFFQMTAWMARAGQRKKTQATKRKRTRRKRLCRPVGPRPSWRAGCGADSQVWVPVPAAAFSLSPRVWVS